MPRRVGATFSGRQEEVWFTKNGGLMGAYDLTDWYQGLSVEHQSRLLSIHHAAEERSGMMMSWDKAKMTNGEMEIHRSIMEQFAWQYSSVPPLLSEIFGLVLDKDEELAQLVVDEWLARAKKTKSAGAKLSALSAVIEFHWRCGYIEAKTIREQGLHNEDLKLVEKYGKDVVKLLMKQQLPATLRQCKPLDRLFLLYKLMGKKNIGLDLINKLENAGYGGLFEVIAYEKEFSKMKN